MRMTQIRNLIEQLRALAQEGKRLDQIPKLSKRFTNLSPKQVKFIKKSTSKTMRKLGKLDPESAPTRRPTQGWAD